MRQVRCTLRSGGIVILPRLVDALASRGVEFRVYKNTLESRKIDEDRLLMEAKIVPSGVAEVARLQAKEGFVYLKP